MNSVSLSKSYRYFGSTSNRSQNNTNKDHVYISFNDFQDMKQRAQHKNKLDILEQQQENYLQKKQYQESYIKQQNSQKISQSLQNINNLSEYEIMKKQERQKILDKANLHKIENLDEVRQMNKMVQYSKCVTVRDCQLQEKQRIKNENEKLEQQQHIKMEIQRLKQSQQDQDKKYFQTKKAKQDCDYLTKQITERKLARKQQEYNLQIERKQKQDQIEQDIELETKQKQQKKLDQQKVLKELENSHQLNLQFKQQAQLQQKEELDKIKDYVKNRDKVIQQRKEDEMQKQIQKQKIISQISDQQLQDTEKQQIMDSIRAKRSQDEMEIRYRDLEIKNAQLKIKQNQDLLNSRQKQIQQKNHFIQDQAYIQKQDFDKENQEIQQKIELNKILQSRKKDLYVKNQEELSKQIQETCNKRNYLKNEIINEFEKNKQESENYKQILENAKEQKLVELQKWNIPEKYQSGLAKTKIN